MDLRSVYRLAVLSVSADRGDPDGGGIGHGPIELPRRFALLADKHHVGGPSCLAADRGAVAASPTQDGVFARLQLDVLFIDWRERAGPQPLHTVIAGRQRDANLGREVFVVTNVGYRVIHFPFYDMADDHTLGKLGSWIFREHQHLPAVPKVLPQRFSRPALIDLNPTLIGVFAVGRKLSLSLLDEFVKVPIREVDHQVRRRRHLQFRITIIRQWEWPEINQIGRRRQRASHTGWQGERSVLIGAHFRYGTVPRDGGELVGVSAGDAFDDVGLMSLGDEEDPAIRHRIARVVAQDASDASAPLQPYIPLDLLRIGLGEFTDNHRRFVPGGVHPQWIVIAIGADVQRHFKLAIGMAHTHRPAVSPRNLFGLIGVRHAPFPTGLFDRLAGLVIEQLPDHPHIVRFRLSRLGRSIRGPGGRFLLRRQFLGFLYFKF